MAIYDAAEAPLITRPSFGIQTLRRYTRETLRARPNLPVVLKFSEVTGATELFRPYWSCLAQTELLGGLKQFAQINNLLIAKGLDATVHAWLERTFVAPQHATGISALRKLHELDSDPPDLHVVFHRLNALFAIRTLLGRGENTGTPVNLQNGVIGDIGLLGNDFLNLDHDRKGPLARIAMFLPKWEIDNPPDIGNAIGRVDWMREHLAGTDPKVMALRAGMMLDTTRVDNVPIAAYALIVFAIYAAVTAGVVKDGICVLNIDTMTQPPLQVAAADVESFLCRRAQTLAEFRMALSGDGWTEAQLHELLTSDRRLTDFTAIRQRPLLRIDDAQTLVLDVGFVIDLLGDGMYYTYFNALPSNRRERFAELWGRAFELYVVDLFRAFHPPTGSVLIRPPTLAHAFVQYGDGASPPEVDAILDRGRTMIACEMKASRLDLNCKLSRDPTLIERDIRRKFVENDSGKPKAVRQLARSADALVRGNVPGLRVPEVVYPVMISEERSFESFEMNTYLNHVFAEYRNPQTSAYIKPLTTMSIDELEQILPLVADETVTWEELLDSRFDGTQVRNLSVRQALYNLHLMRPLPERPNTLLRDRFSTVLSALEALNDSSEDS